MMEITLKDDEVQIVKIELAAGAHMPRHVATADAFLVVEEGDALLIYRGEARELMPGCTALIPAHEQHILKIITDFKGYIVLPREARIDYACDELNVN